MLRNPAWYVNFSWPNHEPKAPADSSSADTSEAVDPETPVAPPNHEIWNEKSLAGKNLALFVRRKHGTRSVCARPLLTD